MAVANPHMLDELYSFTTCDMLVTDLDTGIELYSGTVKSHSINKTSTKTPIRAGIGGITWVELEDASEFTIEVVELREKLDLEALKLSGSMQVETKEMELTSFPKNYTLPAAAVGTQITFELDKTPLPTEKIAIYNTVTGVPLNARRITLNAKEIQIEMGEIQAGANPQLEPLLPALTGDELLKQNDIVFVGSYKYNQTDAEVINIVADQVGTNVAVTLKQPLYGPDRKIKKWRQYHFYRCSLGTEFTQESATEMAEQNTTTTFTVLKDSKREHLGYVAYVDAVAGKSGLDSAPFKRPNRNK